MTLEISSLAELAAQRADPLAKVREQVVHQLMIYGWKIGAISLAFTVLNGIVWEVKRRRRKRYYNEDYLQSDAWKRKRSMVLRRDGGKCVSCGAKATDVHHTRYAREIGKEPISWLVSVCPRCHAAEHADKQAA